MLFSLALKSLRARKVTVGLTVLSISISVLLLLAIHHIKNEAKAGFTSTVSGVDLIVGARTGQLNLLLYSVFRIGNATNNISWESYQTLAGQKEVAWAVPISLGDSHKGFRVMGTTEAYFTHFQYGNKRALEFASGKIFANTFDAVLGADVAKKLNYKAGDKIVLAHGMGSTSFSEHSDNPFTVVGILKPTGTPADQTVHVQLEGIEAMHEHWHGGVDLSQLSSKGEVVEELHATPESITAFMVGLKSKHSIFTFQRKVNQYEDEALLAILPGVALAELWRTMGMVEGILLVIAWMVLAAALIGMSTMMLAAMRERRQEFAVLRAIGASPWFVLALVELEALVTALVSIALAVLLLVLTLFLLQDFLLSQFGLAITPALFKVNALVSILSIICAAVLVGIIPAFAAYRASKR